MSKRQLELAFVSCIYFEPVREKKHGLCGIDRSMFDDPILFELIEILMRTEFNDPSELPDDVLDFMINHKLCSKFDEMNNNGYSIPALYRMYGNEIEKRSVSTVAPWI